jgi:hypothetical protein
MHASEIARQRKAGIRFFRLEADNYTFRKSYALATQHLPPREMWCAFFFFFPCRGHTAPPIYSLASSLPHQQFEQAKHFDFY